MNYYKHHIGDYDAATAHLSMLEDAAYRRLLSLYYRKESPIPLDHAQACRLVRAQSEDERAAVSVVLEEFFFRTADGWRHARCDVEIAESQAKAEANRRNGQRGGRPPAKRNPSQPIDQPKENPLGSLSVSSGNPEETLATSHKPLAISKAKELPPSEVVADGDQKPDPVATIDKTPHNEIIAAYHEILPMCAIVRIWDEGRRALLRSRWREDKARQSIVWWRNFFEYVRGCPFLVGQVELRGREPFTADLEWLIRPTNFRKVIEGRYEGRSP